MAVKPIKGPFTYEFARPSVTATVVLYKYAMKGNTTGVNIVMGRRKKTSGAYPGYLCLPGGFLDTGIDDNGKHFGETTEQTAIRESFEEINVRLSPYDLRLLCVKSDPATDPRCHVVNVCYLGRLPDDYEDHLKANDDLESVEVFWFPLCEIDLKTQMDMVQELNLAFNHAEILLDALNMLEE